MTAKSGDEPMVAARCGQPWHLKACAACRQRVIEHNLLVVAKYYDHITFARLCELLDLSREEVQYLLALNLAYNPLPSRLTEADHVTQSRKQYMLHCSCDDVMKARHQPASPSSQVIHVPRCLRIFEHECNAYSQLAFAYASKCEAASLTQLVHLLTCTGSILADENTWCCLHQGLELGFPICANASSKRCPIDGALGQKQYDSLTSCQGRLSVGYCIQMHEQC